jgi:uncharacterized membrane protein YhhN
MPARPRLASALGLAVGGALAADLALALTGRARIRRVTKPLIMPLVAARLLANSGSRRPGLRDHTVAALLLSCAGDAAILGESDRALAGGAAWFGLAQLFYVRGFRRAGSRPSAAVTLPIVLAAAGGIGGYWPRAGALRPVLVCYPPLLAAMAVSASGLGDALPAPAARRIVAGARVFLASDTIVGAQRFLDLTPRQRDALEVPAMVTYVAAQWLIADGVGRATRG